MKVNNKIILSFSIVLVTFSLVIFMMGYFQIKGMVDKNMLQHVETKGKLGYALIEAEDEGDWQIKGGKLYKGNLLINDNFELVDNVKTSTGGRVTIFLGDTRIATTLVNHRGERAVGTKASKEVVEESLNMGQIFLGEATVLGRDYITYCRPLRDSQGRVIGMWSVGVENAEINKDIDHIMSNIAAVLFFMLICGIALSGALGNIMIRTLSESEERYRIIFDNAADPICVCDMRLNIMAINAVASKLFGYTEEEILSTNLASLVKTERKVKIKDGIQKFLKDGYGLFQTALLCKDGTFLDTEVNARKIYWNGSPAMLAICRDVTARKKAEENIRYLSYHDQLTGLYNRRFYEEELKRLDVKRNLPLSIIMGDVNGLKLINDSFGHSAGDELLKKSAEVLKKVCRADDIVARIGGDEFVILLPKTDTAEASKIVDRIKKIALQEKVESMEVSISFGYETKVHEGMDLKDLLRKAEEYMYRNKLFESQNMRGKTISNIIETLYEKNNREQMHSKRVAALCEEMGIALGMSEAEIINLKTAGLFHDIGKIAIDEKILNKSGALTEYEWEEIKRHSEIGFRILGASNDMPELAGFVLAHHERWNGTGYPKGLKEEEIPYIARIMAIADSYDAMTSESSYHGVLSREDAIEVLKKNAGVKFDPKLVKVFVEKVMGEDMD